MARDRLLAKRNALAIPGALIAFYATVGILYVTAYRAPSGPCASATMFLVGATCYHVLPFMVALLIVGLVMVGLAIGLLRGRVEYAIDELLPGTPTYLLVSFFASLVVVLGLAAAVLGYIQRREHYRFRTPIGAGHIYTQFLLEILAAFALMALVPLVVVLVGQMRRRRRFIAAAQEEDSPQQTLTSPPTQQGEDFVPAERWPGGDDDEDPASL